MACLKLKICPIACLQNKRWGQKHTRYIRILPVSCHEKQLRLQSQKDQNASRRLLSLYLHQAWVCLAYHKLSQDNWQSLAFHCCCWCCCWWCYHCQCIWWKWTKPLPHDLKRIYGKSIMENNICNNGSFKIEGKGRDEWPTSSRLCLLTRIDAHVETSITWGLDSTFLEKISASDLLWINSGSPAFPVIGNSGTISCRKRRPRNARGQSND